MKLQINDDCTSQRFLDGLIQPGPQYKAIKVMDSFFFFLFLYLLPLVMMFTMREANGQSSAEAWELGENELNREL